METVARPEPECILHPHHADELFTASGIAPEVAAARGYRSVTADELRALGFAPYQCRPGLLVPHWTLAGVQVGYLVKPDRPRIDPKKGKPLKYEAPRGSRPHFDVHPQARPLLADPAIPVAFTEGAKKADAAWSRGMLCVSITSVWMFLNGRLVVPDLDELPLQGRVARVIYDSDVTRKPEVAEALLRFCETLDRRGARVEVVYLPEGEEGGKVGLDDWFAAGGTVAELDALARPWDGIGPGIHLRAMTPDDADRRVAALEAEVRHLRDENRAVIHAAMSLPQAELRLALSTGALTLSKLSRGDVDPDGNVVLSAGEIARDHRAKPDPGERVATTNPDGTLPLLPRSNVRGLMAAAVEVGAVVAAPIPVDRKHATTGASWRDTAWVVPPVQSLAALLNPWVAARVEARTPRKPRTISPPCPHCGETHPIKRVDYCAGCGGQVREPVIIKPVLAAPDPAPSGRGDKLSPVLPPPTPAPITTKGISYLRPAPLADEPAWLADVPPVEEGFAEQQRAPWEDGLDPPLIPEAQAILESADHADGDAGHHARSELGSLLAERARARGRAPVPKPTPLFSAERRSHHFADVGD